MFEPADLMHYALCFNVPLSALKLGGGVRQRTPDLAKYDATLSHPSWHAAFRHTLLKRRSNTPPWCDTLPDA